MDHKQESSRNERRGGRPFKQHGKPFNQRKKFDREEYDDIIYGVRAVIEAVRAERPINRIFIQKGMNKELFYELKEELANKKYALQFVPVEKLDRMTQQNHQGVIAQVSPVSYYNIEEIVTRLLEKGEMANILILDRLTDVRNFGAIARTAECTGVHAIVIPTKDSVSVTADAIKTSAGALNKIPVCKVADLSSVVHFLKESGVQVVAATEKTDRLVFDLDMTLPTAVILGSEEDGVSMRLLSDADIKAKIPMTGSISSFNVSVSAGIFLYEIARQRMNA
ncbi:MAG: 23S rRNA (guanosine(2251)-2'-O)-methyltransferase RlmB [Crocinitomicaceae bacterium]|nr:23S rRNA (guanosine(2251)-2'-O)-methyltransferase RlmB [Crocinitomicaceae bacterium]MBK8924881.1 23S rRNA (guanosine(2251)-2'-O)-methyltransferase RlmB [Crocinitomicaceae bacterium]